MRLFPTFNHGLPEDTDGVISFINLFINNSFEHLLYSRPGECISGQKKSLPSLILHSSRERENEQNNYVRMLDTGHQRVAGAVKRKQGKKVVRAQEAVFYRGQGGRPP